MGNLPRLMAQETPSTRTVKKRTILWEEVLAKDSLSNIIEWFAQVVVEKDEDTEKDSKETNLSKIPSTQGCSELASTCQRE